jgi:c-di-GMP-binding flagellar brake protein YcgR
MRAIASGTGSEIDPAGPQDRRRFLRARVDGNAFALVDGRYMGAYVVRDLSAGGAHLVGDHNLAIGQVVQILLRVGKQFSQGLQAEVVRRKRLASGEQSLAVAFSNLAPDLENSLQNLAAEFSAQKYE